MTMETNREAEKKRVQKSVRTESRELCILLHLQRDKREREMNDGI